MIRVRILHIIVDTFHLEIVHVCQLFRHMIFGKFDILKLFPINVFIQLPYSSI